MRHPALLFVPLVLVTAILSAGCAHYVTVERPPVIDLRQYQAIGIVELGGTDDEALRKEATHRLLATLQRSQPGIRMLELGSEREVLARVGASEMDAAAIQAIGREFGVDAVLTGDLTVSHAQPRVTIGEGGLGSMNARVQVDGALKGKLREARSGAIVWTNGAHGTWTLGGVAMGPGGGALGVSDPARKYDEMLSDLVRVATRDFRPTYERQRVED